MGTIYLSDRKFTDALEELTIAIEIYHKEPVYHNALGLAYFAKGMNLEAERRMKEAIRLSPEFPEAHVNLSAVYLVGGEWDKAISESKKALKSIFYRTPEKAHFNVGWGYYNRGDYEEALANLKKAVELNPRYPRAYYGMGLVLDEMNRGKDSIASYKEAIKLSPDYLDAHYRLGRALLKNKENRGALKAFGKVIEIAPESEQARSAGEYIGLMR